jgi:hypothetical protein
MREARTACAAFETGARAGIVVNLASWADAHLTGLAPHEPEQTEIIIMLEIEN